jgi:hypothetical protein
MAAGIARRSPPAGGERALSAATPQAGPERGGDLPSEGDGARHEPLHGWKRAQFVVHPDSPHEVRFAGPVEAGRPYRIDDVFQCRRGHRRLEPSCTCGFYAVDDPSLLGAHAVRTALLRVTLEGRVVRHPECLRGERQRVRQVTVSGWCELCVRPAVVLAATPPLFGVLPAPWLRTLPVCERDQGLFAVALGRTQLEDLLGVPIVWDEEAESPVAASLRRLSRARRGAR